MSNVCIMKFGGNTLANKQKLLLAAQLIKSRWDKGLVPVVVASANGNLTDVLLDHAFSIAPNPDKRELDMLITTGERVSVALLSIALRALGVPSVSLTGSQLKLNMCRLWPVFKELARIKKLPRLSAVDRMCRLFFWRTNWARTTWR